VDELDARTNSILDELSSALRASGITVQRAIIDTSPSFGAASHWQMLLLEFSRRFTASR